MKILELNFDFKTFKHQSNSGSYKYSLLSHLVVSITIKSLLVLKSNGSYIWAYLPL